MKIRLKESEEWKLDKQLREIKLLQKKKTKNLNFYASQPESELNYTILNEEFHDFAGDALNWSLFTWEASIFIENNIAWVETIPY